MNDYTFFFLIMQVKLYTFQSKKNKLSLRCLNKSD